MYSETFFQLTVLRRELLYMRKQDTSVWQPAGCDQGWCVTTHRLLYCEMDIEAQAAYKLTELEAAM